MLIYLGIVMWVVGSAVGCFTLRYMGSGGDDWCLDVSCVTGACDGCDALG